MSTTEEDPDRAQDNGFHGILAFYRLSRSLRKTELPLDLTWERLSTLCAVAEREPISISELSAAEEVTAPTISRMIAALQELDLVRCVVNRNDSRSVLVTCTTKGRSMLQRGVLKTLAQVAGMLERLESDALEEMEAMIRKVRASKR